MLRSMQKFGVPVLFVGAAMVSGCGGSAVNTAPTTLSVQPAATVDLAADPDVLRTEAIADQSCVGGLAHGTRLVVVISGDAQTSVRGLHFRFVPASGATIFPEVIPIPGPSPMVVPAGAIPPLSPLPPLGVAPLPTSMPIPLPAPQRLPFLASFGCTGVTDGILVVTADFFDHLGQAGTSELRARVTP